MYLPLFLLLAANVPPQLVPQTFLSAVNAASLDSPVSPGAIVSVFLSGTLVPAFPPPEQVSVVLDSAAGHRLDISDVVGVRDYQLNAVLPHDTPIGRATLRVLRDGAEFLATAVDVRPAAPAVFTASGEGTGPAATTPVSRLASAATPGNDISLWATGLGAVIPSALSVEIGGQPAQITYAGIKAAARATKGGGHRNRKRKAKP